ncbi:hypothetical protein VTJ49DRAFT_7698 [Mycothermus thermophilus]|uniref:Uncharacterized protein n=1 Tax=Humicola insolens TaxID=85995 RepID=A0ABR3VG70_HUMIN
MWVRKRCVAGNDAEVTEVRYKPAPRPVANFSYPRTDFVHLHRDRERPSTQDSQASESSAPDMAQDHGSDLSSEDENHYHVSPQVPRDGSRGKRLGEAMAFRFDGPEHNSSIAATSTDSIPILLPSPTSTPPGSPSNSSSSLPVRWPFQSPPQPVQTFQQHQQQQRQPSPPSTSPRKLSLSTVTSKSTPSLAILAEEQGRERDLHVDTPKFPPPPHPKTTTTAPPPAPAPVPVFLINRPLPPLPPTATRRPSSPTVPPLISVFEFDSDNEDDTRRRHRTSKSSSPCTDAPKSLARRFLHGLAHPHHHHRNPREDIKNRGHERKPKQTGLAIGSGVGRQQDHKRSASDEGPSARSARTAGRSRISRTLNAASRYHSPWRRGVQQDEEEEEDVPVRTAVSMDLPRHGGLLREEREREGEGLGWLRRFKRRS